MQKNIFILVSRTQNARGSIIREFTHNEYNHVAVSFSEGLEEMYSFARYRVNTPLWGGFVRETPSRYLYGESPVPIKLYMLVAEEEEYAALRASVDRFIENADNEIYDSFGAASAHRGKHKKIKDAYTCVTFAAELLGMEGVYTVAELQKQLDYYLVYSGTLNDYIHGELDLGGEYFERLSPWQSFKKTVAHFAKLTKRAIKNK